MSIRLGIIGLSADQSAWATGAHAGPLKSPPLSDKYTITALATSSPESAKAAAKLHGIPEEKAYHSAEAIAHDPDVDMVVISVKLPLHKELAIPALNAKKDIFMEWPLGIGLQQAEELADLAKKQGVKTVVGLQARLSPTILKAKEIIDSGVLGRIINTTLTTSGTLAQNLPVKSSYLNDPKSGTNLVSIPTAHALDPLCFILGEFKYLNATTATTFPTVQFNLPDGKKTDPIKRDFVDCIFIQGVLESGAMASFVSTSTTDATPGHFEWIIAGEKGSLKLESSSLLVALSPPTLYQYFPKEDAKWEEVKVASVAFGGIGEVYAAFADGKKEAFADFDGAVKRHKMVEAIYRSAEKGTRESY